jgi:hypothetical protein
VYGEYYGITLTLKRDAGLVREYRDGRDGIVSDKIVKSSSKYKVVGKFDNVNKYLNTMLTSKNTVVKKKIIDGKKFIVLTSGTNSSVSLNIEEATGKIIDMIEGDNVTNFDLYDAQIIKDKAFRFPKS